MVSAAAAAQNADSIVVRLVAENDVYALERLTPQQREELSPVCALMTEAVTGSCFNDLPASCNAIQTLVNEHWQEVVDRFGEDIMGNLFSMLLGNLRVMREHESAVEVATALKTMMGDEDSQRTLDAMIRFNGAMAALPRPYMTRPDGDSEVPLRIRRKMIRKALGDSVEMRSLMVDAQIGGRSAEMIFDTGCSQFSFVSEEFARRHGIRIVHDSVMVIGAAVSDYASIGVADSLCIGDITMYNPAFIVMAPNPGLDTLVRIDAVLGTDFMTLAGEVRLYPSEGRMVVPSHPTPRPASGRNLALDATNGGYTLLAECGGEEVVMGFDTGSSATSMSTTYFTSHREAVEREGRLKDMSMGGFGGSAFGRGYVMPRMDYTVGGSAVSLEQVAVYSDMEASTAHLYDGWMGVDALLPMSCVVLNFGDMFVAARRDDDPTQDASAAAEESGCAAK